MPKYKFTRKEMTTVQEIESMINRTRWGWLKSIVAFLFLYGCRISEALGMKRRDFWRENGYLVARIGVLKRRKGRKGPYENMPHLIHVTLKAPFMEEVLLPYLEGIEDADTQVWNRTRQLVWMRLKELNPKISAHVFRHDRLMKLALRGGTEAELMDWAGWSDPRPAGDYIRATGRLAAKLADKVVE